MIKELILFSPERWQFWLSLIGKQYHKLYYSGDVKSGFAVRRLVSVAPSDYEGYIELVSEPV